MAPARVPFRPPAPLQRFIAVLRLGERQGQRCGGPILLAGLVLGAGVVELSSGPLGQTSRFSLELLILLVLQLAGPMLVSLLAMALLLPPWLEHVGRRRARAWRAALPAAALVGALLLLLCSVSCASCWAASCSRTCCARCCAPLCFWRFSAPSASGVA
jgi:hypothetical protein